ncbi:MAG: FAD-binding oxidoreductase [Pseudomonadota bacterium]
MRLYPDHAYAPEPAPSYWQATVPEAAPGVSVESDLTVDTAIIGGGFTGLNAALRLAERGAEVALLDAAHPGWGASGRNGGFVCLGGSKLDYETQIKRYGRDATRAYVDRQRASIDHVAENLSRYGIDADRHSNGEWMLYHSPKSYAREAAGIEIEQSLGMPITRYEQPALDERGMAGPAFHGGYHLDWGFAINPLKYAHGLRRATEAAGVQVYSRSRVESVVRDNGYRLTVNGCTVRARRLIVGANGYAKDGWIDWMSGRFLPVLSSIMVTRPLTHDELQAQGWWSDQAAYDSRALIHYFRLLPEKRFMFGMRGGSSLSRWADQRLARRIREEFDAMFPAWAHVETDHRWTGLLALARSYSQYVGRLGDWPDAWTAFAYHGNGVAMGSYCGRLMADMALGDLDPTDLPPIMSEPPPRFPLPQARMAYIKGYYALWDLGEALRG